MAQNTYIARKGEDADFAAVTVKLTVTSATDFTSVSTGSVTVELYYIT